MRPISRPHRQPLVTAPMAGHSTVPDFGRQAPAGFGVRRARSPDAEAAATVLRASISMLCAADHGNQLDIVARRHETPDRDPSGGHGAIPSGPGDIDAVVFSGGRSTMLLAGRVLASGASLVAASRRGRGGGRRRGAGRGPVRRLYACPSRPVPVSTWDFSSPDKVIDTFELGRGDGARFLGEQQARAPVR